MTLTVTSGREERSRILDSFTRVPSREWADPLASYTELMNMQDAIDKIVDNLHNDVAGLLDEVRAEERHNFQLRVAMANKIAPQDVTEEMILSYSDLLSEKDASLVRIGRQNARKYGRPLLQRLHPDKGGDAHYFNLVRRAIEAGDAELVRIFLYQADLPAGEPDELSKRIESRIMLLRGSQIFQIVRSFVSRPRQTVVNELSSLLRARLFELKRLNTPGAFNDVQENE